MLALFCLNIIGYRMVARYYAGKSSADMQITLDQQKFRESDLVRFKIPLNQPYIINSDGYESIEGNMDYKGVNYQFVKKRILNDTLEIVCIPNITRTQIYNNEEDLAKQLSDIVNTSASKKSTSHQQLNFSISEFTQDHYFALYTLFASATLKHTIDHTQFLSFNYLQDISKPPQV